MINYNGLSCVLNIEDLIYKVYGLSKDQVAIYESVEHSIVILVDYKIFTKKNIYLPVKIKDYEIKVYSFCFNDA